MTYSVIGAGETAKLWDGGGYSIGCNDSEKHGHPVTELLLVNHPRKFSEDRFNTIISSKANIFSHKPGDWQPYFQQKVNHLPLSPFSGRVKRSKDIIYKSASSPFIAISKAFAMGATEIILYGIDFQTHSTFKPGSSTLKNELFNYRKLIEGIEGQHGVKVWLGAEGSRLEEFVEVKK